MNISDKKAQIIYLSHGGGPLPILHDPNHQTMIDFMTSLSKKIHQPETIIVFSAHWEETEATILASPAPQLFYDYYGFPAESYQLKYPAPGHPELAQRLQKILQKHQIPSQLDTTRGFDHGVFIPLKMIFPEANIPVIQISLLHHLDPAKHLQLGEALQELLQENILIIGSGFSFHNMQAFFTKNDDLPNPANDTFQNWLIETITSPISESERRSRLINWEHAPFARFCHPREDHLLPLHICQGLAGLNHPAKLIFDAPILHFRSVAFLW